MIRKHRILIKSLILTNLIIALSFSYANPNEADRATKTISLRASVSTMVQAVEKETSLQEQADVFEKSLRESNPNFSESQIASMRSAYEDTIIEDVTEAQIDTEKIPTQSNLAIQPTSSKQNTQRLADISELVEGSLSSEAISGDVLEESKKTIVLLTVKKGDTLGDIAKRNYGEPSMYIAIYDANKDKLKSPNFIPEGITLTVPVIDNTNKAKFQALLRKYEAKWKR